jgi:serine/threonine protein phosphatase PrpC
VEIASAQIQRPDKGEDAYIVRSLDDTGSAQLIAVADGLSLNDGRAAADWVINYLARITDADTPRKILEGLRQELSQSQYTQQSETTLTCGILREVSTENHAFLRFEYFAIGDSPIWKVVTGDSRYPFQRLLVHGAPYPAETARVYSTLRLQEKDIQGGITLGTIEIESGEVLVVCTDGVPEREIFIRDISNMESAGTIALCRWLFQASPYDNDKLAEVLAAYDKRGVLFDDATIITARLLPPLVNRADAHEEKFADAEADKTTPASNNMSLNVEPTDNLLSENGTDLPSPADPSISSSDENLKVEQNQAGLKEIHITDNALAPQLASTPPDSNHKAMPAQGELTGSSRSGVAPDCASRTEAGGTEENAGAEGSSATRIEDQNASSNEPSSSN